MDDEKKARMDTEKQRLDLEEELHKMEEELIICGEIATVLTPVGSDLIR